MPLVELVLLLLAAVAVGGTLVRLTPLSLPILLVIVGFAASFLPAFEGLRVDPELFLLLFVPPILFADAWSLPRRDFVRTLRPVLLLALGLVALTVVAIGYLMHWLVPAMPLAVAFTLGAIVSPTDAVATVATTSELPLPARVVQIVNAESLLNDASGLVAFKLAVAAAATGLFSSSDIARQFLLLSGGGIAMGIAVEWASRKLRRRMIRLEVPDPTVITLVTVLTPYVAYVTAEWLGVSGILAVVAAGLWASAHEIPDMTAQQRMHAREVWRMIGFAMNGLVFVLLGLELRSMVTGVSHYEPGALALYAVALWVALTALRLAWVFASAYLRFRLRWGWTGSRHGPDPRRVFLVGWASVRGSITLATALSVPALTASGTAFPERELVVFLAAATIILTLSLNGVPLPFLIRRLELTADPSEASEERHARVEAAKASAQAVEAAMRELAQPEDRLFATQLLREAGGRLELYAGAEPQARMRALRWSVRRSLRMTAIEAERRRLRELRDADEINDETLRAIEEELDERELLAGAAIGRPRE
ncbi:MAG: Na+/H+ antiporter [Betaproteobacteria bacterium]|nr:Na+/H+ antiporter [Betaproteobacteria bacterium]